ncbi:MAG: C-GCAxxG-C-C family protein [Proteobacteria bacterium]|nr:C-GCAxxG-C-C family protein [Pseudomonadota bacterium]
MNELEILKLKHQGYCCSQIMVHMILDLMDRENENLIRFARGLCMGGGMEKGPCGILTAGMSILSMMAGDDTDRWLLMQETYLTFFQTLATGGAGCKDITGEYFPGPHPEICGQYLSRSFSQLMAILVENGFDPTDPLSDGN